jgi:hypothetical protein
VKTWYKRTNRRGYSAQITVVERRRARLRRLRDALREDREELTHPYEEGESPGVSAAINSRYYIGNSGRFFLLNSPDPVSLVSPSFGSVFEIMTHSYIEDAGLHSQVEEASFTSNTALGGS